MTQSAPPETSDPAPPDDPSRTEASPLAGLAAGAVLVAAGLALFTRALHVGADRGITLGGPTFAPIVVTGLWVVVAVALPRHPIAAWRRRVARPAAARRRPGGCRSCCWRLLVAYAFVLKYTVVGYVLATVVFYVGAAQLLSHPPGASR